MAHYNKILKYEPPTSSRVLTRIRPNFSSSNTFWHWEDDGGEVTNNVTVRRLTLAVTLKGCIGFFRLFGKIWLQEGNCAPV